MNYYFLSLGTNINPEENVWHMLDALLELFGALDVSLIEQTEATGFSSAHYFLNLCVRIKSEDSHEELKKKLVQIEIDLGRDRSHPDSKRSDRPADIDILFSINANMYSIPEADLPKEKYVLPTFIELARCLGYDFSAVYAGIRKERRLERDGLIIGDKSKKLIKNSTDL